MTAPILTPSQRAALEKALEIALAGAAGKAQTILVWDAAIANQELVEEAFKAQFDYYDQSVIRQYELERRWLDGQLLLDPIIESDLTDFVSDTGRLYDVADVENQIYTPKRISQFDGSPLSLTNDEHETFLIPEQNQVTSDLVTYPSQIQTWDVTAQTASTLTASSVVLAYSSDEVEAVSVNDLLFIGGGAIVKVVSIDGGVCVGEDTPPQPDKTSCELDNGTWVEGLGIEVLIPPATTIAAGATLGIKSYEGFTDAERIAKTATDPAFQPVMDYLLAELHDKIDRRLTVLGNQNTILLANDDPNLDLNALINVVSSENNLNTFLGVTPPSTIDISNVGLGSINTESSTRLGQVTARIAAIPTAITTGDYYDTRYDYASGRSRLDNGSLRLIIEYTKARDGAVAGEAAATELAARYDELLNL